MTDIPIIFSTPMIKALLAGNKTMTRRLAWTFRDVNDNHTKLPSSWQKSEPGDRLWVRENQWRNGGYSATDPPNIINEGKIPSIHMRRVDSRLTLTIIATKIEPLDSISAFDCRLEGIRSGTTGPQERALFRELWEKLHGEGSWKQNPEVVALSFTIRRSNIDAT